jgi:hypothetical protein
VIADTFAARWQALREERTNLVLVTTAVIECWNTGKDGVELQAASVMRPGGLTRRWDVRLFAGEAAIPPSAHVVTLAAWPIRFGVDTRRIRIRVRARSAAKPDAMTFQFDLCIPSLAERRHRDGALREA